MRPTGRFFCAVHSLHPVFRVRRASCPLPRKHTFPPHASYCARQSGVLICDASPSSLLPRRPFFRSPQHARRPVKALHIPPAACVTQLFPAARFPAECFTSCPAKPCIPCRRLSSSGARRQSKPASRQRPIRPHHRKSTAFSRRAALSRDIAPFQAAVALHGQTRRIKSALHGHARPFRPYFYQNLERVSARFRLICQKFVTSNAPKARFPTYKPRAGRSAAHGIPP